MTLRSTLRLPALIAILVSQSAHPAIGQFRSGPAATLPAQPEQRSPVVIDPALTTIDPARFLPESLAQRVTVRFQEAAFAELIDWLKDELELPVVVHADAIKAEVSSLDGMYSDSSTDAPLYLLLNRLAPQADIGWYWDAGVLHLTSTKDVLKRQVRRHYVITDLLDAGYDPLMLCESVMSATSGEWIERDGSGGSLMLLGDVLFLRVNPQVHDEVAGFLAALRSLTRRTLLTEPPAHAGLREQLGRVVTANFRETPLNVVLTQLGKQVELEFRIDWRALSKGHITLRQPVSLQLTEFPLEVVLRNLLEPLALGIQLGHGAAWVTTRDKIEEARQSALYDVRDLCRDHSESQALANTIQSQSAGAWEAIDSLGGIIDFVRPGVMLVGTTDEQHTIILELIESYREALRQAKPRPRPSGLSTDPLTVAYRLPKELALELRGALPRLVRPGTWRSAEHPTGLGTLDSFPSRPEVLTAEPTRSGGPKPSATGPGALPLVSTGFLCEYQVLWVHQTPEAHQEIAQLLHKLLEGDPLGSMGLGASGGFGGSGGMGMGGGGFGGGFP